MVWQKYGGLKRSQEKEKSKILKKKVVTVENINDKKF